VSCADRFSKTRRDSVAPLARFSASELFSVGLRVTFETPRLPGIRSNLHMLSVVPPAQNGQFSRLHNTDIQKTVIGLRDRGKSVADRSVHAEASDGLQTGDSESVVELRRAPNLVCFPAAHIPRSTFQ